MPSAWATAANGALSFVEAYSPLGTGRHNSEADIAELDALDRTGGTARALEDKWW